MSEEQLVGYWAINGAGRIGVIQRFVHYRGLGKYEGKGIDGQKWDSACPQLLNRFEQTFFNAHCGSLA